MTSLTRWAWVWVSSRSLWGTGKPGVLQFMGSQRVRHDWGTELNWTESRLWFFSSHVWMWELNYKESWVPKNWCFWTVGWRRLFRVPWTARRSNQSILKEISPECSLEGLILKLKCQYLATRCKEMTHWNIPWCWEWLKAGEEGDDRKWDDWMASPTQWTWVWVNSGSWWWTGRPGVLRFMGSQRVRHNWATELNWKCSQGKVMNPL